MNLKMQVTPVKGDEIVGAQIGTTITNSTLDIALAIQEGKSILFLTRREMQFMNAFDLGINWKKMAESKTLFTFNEKLELVFNEEVFTTPFIEN